QELASSRREATKAGAQASSLEEELTTSRREMVGTEQWVKQASCKHYMGSIKTTMDKLDKQKNKIFESGWGVALKVARVNSTSLAWENVTWPKVDQSFPDIKGLYLNDGGSFDGAET
ncbi:unnamed protein product, partial [Ilex paraguariensis]